MSGNLCIQIIKLGHETSTKSNEALVWIVLYFMTDWLDCGISCHSDWAALMTGNINDRIKDIIIPLQDKIVMDC